MPRFIALLICFFSFVGISQAVTQNQACQQHHCLAVVDAGSTGTRLYLYSYDLDDSNNPIKINEISSKKITPGFASLEQNQETINAYLTILFAHTQAENIPVYFYATAGMRLLSHPRQQKYYQALQKWFAGQSQWQLADAKTITGSEEGLYGWLAVNYQLGTLSAADKNFVGVMDMGGASVQMVFPVQNADGIDRNDLMEVDIYGQHLQLFVHSFLGLGQTVLSHQFLDSANCFAIDYQLPNGISAQGDALSCQRDISKLINMVHGAGRIVKPAVAANPVNSWYVMGGLTTLLEDNTFHFENQQFTSQSLLEQADKQICHKQWQELHAQYPDNDFVYGYCLYSAYYYALMVNGYGLQPQLPVKYLPSATNTNWSLGVVLHQH